MSEHGDITEAKKSKGRTLTHPSSFPSRNCTCPSTVHHTSAKNAAVKTTREGVRHAGRWAGPEVMNEVRMSVRRYGRTVGASAKMAKSDTCTQGAHCERG